MLWKELFTIIKTYPNDNNYRLDLSKWPKLGRYHPVFYINLLKPYNIKDSTVYYLRLSAVTPRRYKIDTIKEFRTEPSTEIHQCLVT